MSESSDTIERDGQGRFVTGSTGGPGRKPGSRNKLGEQFISDLRDVWEEMGVEALQRCAREEPAQFVRVVASLMPKTIDINQTHSIDGQSVLDAFRAAVAMLGNDAPVAVPKLKVINASGS